MSRGPVAREVGFGQDAPRFASARGFRAGRWFGAIALIALAALIGLAWRAAAGRVVAGILVLLLALAGIASAAWQHFYAAPSGSCNLTLADKIISALQLDSLLPDVFAPRASCADAAVNLFGVPYDFWSLALFVLCAIAASSTLRARA